MRSSGASKPSSPNSSPANPNTQDGPSPRLAVVASIDLNADVGEECGNDIALFDVVTTANVAAGGHAGGGPILIETVATCAARKVAVGAHPSYPDRENFGRLSRHDEYESKALTDLIRTQILDVAAACAASGTTLTHVKAHGALYHDIAREPAAADAFLAAVLDVARDIDADLYVTGSPNSSLQAGAQARDIAFVTEAFIDRLYHPDGTLAPRSQPNAVHADPQMALAQATSIALEGCVQASDGTVIDLNAQTLCVHGDSPDAVAMARAVHRQLTEQGVIISPVARVVD